jgi:hypothetical protein
MISVKQAHSAVVRPIAIISPVLLLIGALGFSCRELGSGILRNHISWAEQGPGHPALVLPRSVRK